MTEASQSATPAAAVDGGKPEELWRKVNDEHNFYRDGFRRLSRYTTVVTILAILAVAAATVAIVLLTRKDVQYVATTADGIVYPITVQKEPLLADPVVANWSARCMTDTFTYTYRNYQQHFSDAGERCFTTEAIYALAAELEKTGTIQAVVSKKLISTATVTGAPTLVEKGEINGVYHWEFGVPGVVSYENVENKKDTLVMWDVLVARVPLTQAMNGVRIVKLRMVPRGDQP